MKTSQTPQGKKKKTKKKQINITQRTQGKRKKWVFIILFVGLKKTLGTVC